MRLQDGASRTRQTLAAGAQSLSPEEKITLIIVPQPRYVWPPYAFPTALTTLLMLGFGASVMTRRLSLVVWAFSP